MTTEELISTQTFPLKARSEEETKVNDENPKVTASTYVDPKKVLTDAKAALDAARVDAQKRIDKLDADHERDTKRYREEKAALQMLLRIHEYKPRGPNKPKPAIELAEQA